MRVVLAGRGVIELVDAAPQRVEQMFVACDQLCIPAAAHRRRRHAHDGIEPRRDRQDFAGAAGGAAETLPSKSALTEMRFTVCASKLPGANLLQAAVPGAHLRDHRLRVQHLQPHAKGFTDRVHGGGEIVGGNGFDHGHQAQERCIERGKEGAQMDTIADRAADLLELRVGIAEDRLRHQLEDRAHLGQERVEGAGRLRLSKPLKIAACALPSSSRCFRSSSSITGVMSTMLINRSISA